VTAHDAIQLIHRARRSRRRRAPPGTLRGYYLPREFASGWHRWRRSSSQPA
jgi:hypothetical protein